jgi:hypothetical protein
MSQEHKKALLVIFTLLFVALLAATTFITLQTQHITIASILIVAAVMLLVDIRWVLSSSHEKEQQV